MQAITRIDSGDAADAGTDNTIPPAERVENFLACVETRQRRSTQLRIAIGAVGLLLAAVASLTSSGLVGSDPRAFAASAGTVVASIFVRHGP